MKFLTALSLCGIFLVGCSAPKIPDFKTIKNTKITKLSDNVYTVTGDAVYFNPNGIGGNLVGMEMDIVVDNITLPHISQTKSAVIQPETDFIVPITFDVDMEQQINDNKSFLKSMLDKLFKDEIEVKYSGHLKVQFLSRTFEVPVEYSETMSLGLKIK